MSGDLCAFELTQPMGMFATLGSAVLLAKACEEKNVEPYIMASGLPYLSPARGPDWFSYFFTHRRVQPSAADIAALYKDNNVLIIASRGDINLFARGSASAEISNELSEFSEARRLFDKFFSIRADVLNKIDDFVGSHFNAGGELGIHYRGRTHRAEAEPVEYGSVIQAALDYFPQYTSVFIATDELEFFEFAIKRLRSMSIARYSNPAENEFRSDHGDNYAKGFDALCDCLLLSRCRGLVKTPSSLSTYSKVLGDEIPVALVGKPRANPYKHVASWQNLKGLGFYPENLLYNWRPQSMRKNNVLAIVAEPPIAAGAVPPAPVPPNILRRI